ncbi:MAG: SIS domain-containing protein [Paracoccaceae bacterium]|nr:SIS domain-containing protein [Paracoccaceae bacterium]
MTPSSLATSATWRELHAQPSIWTDWAEPLAAQAGDVAQWVAARGIEEVWFSGAGTSAFIGDILSAEASTPLRLRSVPTTDFVAAPRAYLATTARVLNVQFGRSGDSSETLGMLDLIARHRPDFDSLHITCNPKGALATRPHEGPGELRRIVLPEATHDAGFAMTSSFSTMLLSAAAVFRGGASAASLPELARTASSILGHPRLAELNRPERAVFLGSGALKGAAREAALKVLELTAGNTLAIWDSALGFRHGPKSAVTPDTHVFVFLHPDPHTRRYDTDIATELEAQFPGLAVTRIGPGGDIDFEGGADPAQGAALYVLPAQVLAARWSAALGLPVDDPFEGQALTRVVSGVKLYALP